MEGNQNREQEGCDLCLIIIIKSTWEADDFTVASWVSLDYLEDVKSASETHPAWLLSKWSALKK